MQQIINQKLMEWWRTVDRATLGILLVLLLLSVALVTTASPAVAERIGLRSFYFLERHVLFSLIAVVLLLSLSWLSPQSLRLVAMSGLVLSTLLVCYTLVAGVEIKGARRWISLLGISLQPSEFLKPCFIVVSAWLLAKKRAFPSMRVATVLYLLVISLLVLQPDFGMVVNISTAFGIQLFLAGLSLVWIGVAVLVGGGGLVGAYYFLPHVTRRIDGFLDPSTSDNYQISRSLEAFEHGGFFGVGPGEGTVKQFLPDSHTDFIFSVMAEEFGVVLCLIVVAMYATIVIRGLLLAIREGDHFTILSVTGLLMLFGLQAFINIGVSIHMLPTKGMTLPFISYGGSSFLAVALTIGMVLALTRKRYGKLVLGYARRTDNE